MELLTLFALAVGLCFDTFAVSVSSGLMKREITFKQALRIAIVLGTFQGLMPAIGWFLGTSIKGFIEEWDHWIAFILLGVLGAKMIYESFSKEEDKEFDPLDVKVMVGMAIATSIDALIVGVSFGMFDVNLPLAVIVIGGVTVLASMLGIFFGKRTGAHYGEKIEVLGGIILIAIGIKIVVQHIWFS
jgi:manganese efflux pump family protein